MIKTEEENKYNILKKKLQLLENKLKKKDEELEEMKKLTKLKQTNFVENLQNLSQEYAEKYTNLQSTLLQKDKEIARLEQRIGNQKDCLETRQASNENGESNDNEEEDRNNNSVSKKKEDLLKTKDLQRRKKRIDGRKCFICKNKGHIAMDCPDYDSKSGWCTYCSKDTHDTEDCWSKKKEDKSYRDGNKIQPSRDNNNTRWCTYCCKNNHNTIDCWYTNKKNENNEKRSSDKNKGNIQEKNDSLYKQRDRVGRREEQNNGRSGESRTRYRDDSKRHRQECSFCFKSGHTFEDCWHREDNEKTKGQAGKARDEPKNDPELMLLLKMVKQWHQRTPQQ